MKFYKPKHQSSMAIWNIDRMSDRKLTQRMKTEIRREDNKEFQQIRADFWKPLKPQGESQ